MRPSQQQSITEADNLDVGPWAPATHDMDAVCVGAERGDRFVSDRKPLEEVAGNPKTGWIGTILSDADLATTGLDENAPNDSGVAISPTPELLSSIPALETLRAEPEVKLSNERSYWLYDGGFSGGSRPHPKTRSLPQDD